MDKEPQFESKDGANPFSGVMDILHTRMQEAYEHHERALVSAGTRPSESPPPAPGAYLVRDYELLDGFQLQTAWLKRPQDKHTPAHGISRATMFNNGVFVHRVVSEESHVPVAEPSFYIVEIIEDESTFFLVDETGAQLFIADLDKRTAALGAVLGEVVGLPLTDGSTGAIDDLVSEASQDEDSFDASLMAMSWETELQQMSPQRFTITS